MRILIVTSTLPRSAADSTPAFVLEMAKNLARKNDVFILAPFDKGSRVHEIIGGVEIFRFPYFFPGYERLAYRGGMYTAFRGSVLAKIQLPFFLASEFFSALYIARVKKIDLFNAHWLLPQGPVAIALKAVTRKPVVITTHGGDVALASDRWAKPIIRATARNCDLITCVSEHAKTKLIEVLPLDKPGKIIVLPMGVYLPPLYEKASNHIFQVLFIGRIVEIKGLNILINAFAELQRNKKIRLIILGDGPLKKPMERLVRDLDLTHCVNFSGYAKGGKKRDALMTADVVVIPSIIDSRGNEEGLPVVALEAMAFGKALIATRTGSLPSIINGENGVLIEPSNPKELAFALEKLMNNPGQVKSLGENARKTAEKYDWAALVPKFENSLANVVKNSQA